MPIDCSGPGSEGGGDALGGARRFVVRKSPRRELLILGTSMSCLAFIEDVRFTTVKVKRAGL